MLKEIDGREVKRIWQVAGKMINSYTAPQIRKDLETFTEIEKRQIGYDQGIAMEKALNAGKILTRVTDRIAREDLSCAPGADTDGIEEVLKKYGCNPEDALVDALFVYASNCVDKAFRYGYYAAMEDEALGE